MITLVISNEDMDDIITIIKSLKYSNVLIDWVIQTVKQGIEIQEVTFLVMLLGTVYFTFFHNQKH